MKKEQIQDFTRRISQCNRGGLILIMYEICFTHIEDARTAYESKNWEEFKMALRRAQRAISELIGALDFSYDLAKELYSVYVFCRDALAKSMYKREIEDLQLAERLLRRLYDAFEKVAAEDTSPPLMSNTQQVYAGYTYGRDDVETYQEFDTSRGFFV